MSVTTGQVRRSNVFRQGGGRVARFVYVQNVASSVEHRGPLAAANTTQSQSQTRLITVELGGDGGRARKMHGGDAQRPRRELSTCRFLAVSRLGGLGTR